jgi:single-stranded DNA-binding protein
MRVGDGDAVSWVNVTCFDSSAIEQSSKLVKGARCYVEGSIKLDEWTSQDGTARHGLSCMSFHARLAAIGRKKPKREKPNAKTAAPTKPNNFYSDEIGF